MGTRHLSTADIRKLLAHAQAIQAILAATPGDPGNPGVARFLREATTPDPGARVPIRDLHATYDTWSRRLDYTPLPLRRFAQQIPNPRQKSNGTLYVTGLRFMAHTHAAQAALQS